ncbi:MAG TPA: hypothetical protein VHX65_20065 [Pirellulales bacterium]|nr:hypothetical protein [Pirellulales bacterium]
MIDGQYWRSLGFYAVGAGGSLSVSLQNGNSSGDLDAGSVMVVNAWTISNTSDPDNPIGTSAGTFSTLEQGPLQTVMGVYSTATGDFNLAATDGMYYDFNFKGQLVLSVDADGNQTKFAYNNTGDLTTITTQGGFTTTFNYSGGFLSSIQDPYGRTTTFQYQSGAGEITSITEPYSSGAGSTPITRFGYNSSGLLDQVTDADGDVTTLQYDPANDRIDKVVNPDSNYWTLTPFLVDGLAPSAGDAPILLAADGQIGNLADSSIPEAQATYVDPNHATWNYQTDLFGLETAEANPNSVVWQWQRDGNGLVSESIAPPNWGGATPIDEQETTSYYYDSRGNLTSQVNPDGSSETWTYGVDDQPTSDTVAREGLYGPVVESSFTYVLVVFGDTLSSTDGDGDKTLFSYTALPAPGSIIALPGGLLLLTTTDPDGDETENVYYTSGAGNGLVQTTTVAYGTSLAMTTTYTYDSNGNPLTTVTPVGTTSYVYDNLNLLASETDPPPTPGAAAPKTVYIYDPLGDQLSVTDPSGNKTSETFSSLGEVATATNADNQTTTYTYDADGNLKTTKDPKGNITTDFYNSLDQLTKVTDPTIAYGTPAITYTYDAWGDLASMDVMDGSSNEITYYDDNAMGEQTEVVEPPTTDGVGHASASETIETSYNALGQAVSVFGFNSATGATVENLQYTYDSADRLFDSVNVVSGDGDLESYDGDGNVVSSDDSADGTTRYAYNALGEESSETDPGEAQTNFTYNALGEILSESQANATGGTDTTSFTYDADGNVLTVKDALGNTTTYTYDADGNGTSVKDPLGNTTTYTYDDDGNNISSTDPLGNTTTYAYDSNDRLLSQTDPMGNTTTYTYDADGNDTSVTTPLGQTTSYAYDGSQETSETDPDGNTTSYQYYADGRLKSQSETVALSATKVNGVEQIATGTAKTSYTYYGDGSLESVTDPDGNVIDYQYNDDGQESSETWYTASGWLSGTPSNTVNYTYTSDGDVHTASDNYSDYTYTYDALDRLATTSNAGTPGGVPTVVLTNAYDHDGNRTSLSSTIAGHADFINTYTYDADDRETFVTQQGASGSGGDAVAYKQGYFNYNAGRPARQFLRLWRPILGRFFAIWLLQL